MLMAPQASFPLANCWGKLMSQQTPHPPRLFLSQLKLRPCASQPSFDLPFPLRQGGCPPCRTGCPLIWSSVGDFVWEGGEETSVPRANLGIHIVLCEPVA